MPRARVLDEEVVDAFEADGLVRHDVGHVVGALVNVGIGDDQQHALGRTFDQAAGGFENGDAGAFRADQRARNVKAVFREQEIQVVAGDAARDVGVTAADQIAVGVGDVFQELWTSDAARCPAAAPDALGRWRECSAPLSGWSAPTFMRTPS